MTKSIHRTVLVSLSVLILLASAFALSMPESGHAANKTKWLSYKIIHDNTTGYKYIPNQMATEFPAEGGSFYYKSSGAAAPLSVGIGVFGLSVSVDLGTLTSPIICDRIINVPGGGYYKLKVKKTFDVIVYREYIRKHGKWVLTGRKRAYTQYNLKKVKRKVHGKTVTVHPYRIAFDCVKVC